MTEDADETIIFINRHFAPLDQALSGRRLTQEAITVRADRYQFPVACGLWLQEHEATKSANRPDETYLQGEMRRLAEAVLVAIDPDIDVAIEESDM